MNQDIRRDLISRNLGIKPINHGQIYPFQIALPDDRKHPLSLEKRQALEKSLLEHQSNLISLIVRRTSAYADEDIEYELVYGAEWLQIAQELNIEKVWAWVFDMTDEQAIATIATMESLTHIPSAQAISSQTNDSASQANSDTSLSMEELEQVLDHKLQLVADSIKNSVTGILSGIRAELDEKLKILNYRIDGLTATNGLDLSLDPILNKLDALQQQLSITGKSQTIEFTGERINLQTASDADITAALKQVGSQDKQIQGAIAAIRYWQQSEQGLTWDNLQRSVRAERNSPHKKANFAEGTYKRLQVIAEIPSPDSAPDSN